MQALKPYLKLLLAYRGRLGLGAILMLVTAASGIGLLALSGWFITATAVTGAMLAAGLAAALNIYIPGGGIRAFAVTRTGARYLERVINHDTVLRLLRDLRGQVFMAIATLPAVQLNRLRSGELLNRLTTDIDRLDGLFLRGLAPSLIAALAIILVALLLMLGSVGVGLITGGGLLLLGMVVLLHALNRGRQTTLNLAAASGELRASVIDHLQGLNELKAFSSLAHHRRHLLAKAHKEQAIERSMNTQIAAGEAVVAAGIQLTSVLVLLTALALYQSGAISGAIAVMMPLAVLALLEPLGVLPGAGWHLARAHASALRLRADLPAESNQPAPTPADVPSSTPIDPSQPPVVLQSVTLIRGAGATVLDDVSLTLKRGEHVGILGPSGSGKSSLAALISGQITADQGAIRRNGSLAWLTQHTDLFSTTIAGNLRIARRDVQPDGIWQVLKAVALDEFVNDCPEGIETWVGEAGTRLSAGQARRLALARLLLTDPEVVILDEPFAGLDQQTAQRAAAGISPWLQGRSVLVLGHDRDTLPQAERWLMLRHGQLHPIKS